MRGEGLAAPELLDLEVASVLRNRVAIAAMTSRRAQLALDDLASLAVHRAAHRHLLPRCWELRENVTIYDAACVALVEALEAPLLTADVGLARAPGLRCLVEVLR